MKIALMRWLDFWVGVPLCFLLSLAAILRRLAGFGRNKADSVPRKVMFIKLSEMGAIILAYPLLTAAKKDPGVSEVFFLTFQRNRGVFALLPGMVKQENILTIRDSGALAFIADTLRALGRMRREKIDMVFDLEFFSRFSVILAYLSGAARRVGFYRYNYEGLYRGSLLTHKAQYNPLLHISKTYLSLWQAAQGRQKASPELGKKIEDAEIILPKIVPGAAELEKARSLLGKYGVKKGNRVFLMNPGEGMIVLREWPLENFISLARKVLEDGNNYVALIGTQDAQQKAGQVLRGVANDRCIDLSGKTEISELPALFAVSEVLISNDCGLAHIASLSRINKFIIFGPESPAVFGPLGENNFVFYAGQACSPCLSALNHRKSSCKDNTCLKAIDWQTVYGLVREHAQQ